MVETSRAREGYIYELQEDLKDCQDMTTLALNGVARALLVSSIGSVLESSVEGKYSFPAAVVRGAGRFLKFGGAVAAGGLGVLSGVSYYYEVVTQRDLSHLEGRNH